MAKETNRFKLAFLFIVIGLYTLFNPKVARQVTTDYRQAQDKRLQAKANEDL